MSRMKKRFKQWLAVLCSMALLTVSVPVSLAEEEAPTEGTSEAGEAPGEEGGYREAPIVGEDITRRSKDAKHFRRSDGSYTMVQYATPVHYEKDGELVDIDNTLTAGVEEDEAAEGSATEVYGTEGNRFQVKFAKKSNGKFLMKLKQEDWSIYWSLTSPKKNKVTGQASNPAESEDPLQLTKLTSEMRYNDIFADTDLQYIVTPTGVKENIIVKKAQTAYTYEFELKVKGVTLSPREDGGIDVLKEGETEASFVIPAPYMFDAAGAESTAARYELEVSKNGKTYTLRVVADAEWINAADRQFPVTIDPAIQLDRDYLTIHDATVAYGTPSAAAITEMSTGWSSSKLFVGKYDTVGNMECAAIVQTDMSELKEARILDAKLRLFYYTGNTTGMQVNAYKVTGSWTKGENFLYNTQVPAYNATPLDYSITPAGATQNVTTTFDITKAVQDWVTSGNNQGILLRSTSWQSGLVKYIASDTGGIAEDPQFIINYRDTKGLEPYWTYTTIAAGRNTAAYINNYNGALTVVSGIASADGNAMPVSIEYIYNHKTLSWHTNYGIKISTTTGTLANSYPFYLTDADGTDHYFYQNPLDTSEYLDEDGLGYTLKRNTSSTNQYYTVTDKGDGKMHFYSDGRLYQIADANGNTQTVTYDSAKKITSVTDGAGRVYTFQYSSNRISRISDPAGRNTQFLYDITGRLVLISNPDGGSTTISYEGSGSMISQMQNSADSTKVVFGNSGAPAYRITSATWYDGSNTQAGKYTFAYRHNDTLITDQDGRKVEYQFNNAGQTVGVVNLQSGQAEYYEFGAPGIPGGTGMNKTEAGQQNKLLGSSKVQTSISNLLTNPSFDSSNGGYTLQSGMTAIWDSSKGHFSSGAVKLTKSAATSGGLQAVQNITGLSAGYYTLSAYVHTGGTVLAGDGVRLKINSYKAAGGYKTSRYSQYVKQTGSSEWVRLTATYYADEAVSLDVGITTAANMTGTFWIDDIQLERGEASNSFNLLENTELKSTSCWTAGNTPAVATISGFPDSTCTSALKSTNTIRSAAKYTQTVKVNGAKGDVFSFGGWGKADSVGLNSLERDGTGEAAFGIQVKYGSHEEYLPFNFGYNGWQFISGKLILKEACTSITFTYDYSYNLNTAFFTRPFLYKEEFGQSYVYDKDGNISSAVDVANSQATFAFRNDNLMRLCNPTGSKFYYTYDSNKNVTYAHTSDGQQYHFTYDAYGNPLTSTISVAKPATSLSAGTKYYVRNCDTGLYLHALSAPSAGPVKPVAFVEGNAKLQWKLISSGETGIYYLQPGDYTALTMSVISSSTSDNAQIGITPGTTDKKFKPIANGDGTFRIMTGVTSYAKCVDGRPSEDPDIRQMTYTSGKLSQKWEFIPVSGSTLKMTSSNTYTDTRGNYLETTTDSRGKVTTYAYNSSKGLLESVTAPNGAKTTYTYDSNNDRLTKAQSGNAKVEYSYLKDLLSEISVDGGNIKYKLNADARGRQTTTQVGTGNTFRTLSTNTWNTRDLLTKMTHGNGGQINYAYDNLDRMSQVWNTDTSKRVEYRYDAEGRLALTRDYLQDQQTRYTYDMAGRLVEVNNLDENWDQGATRTKTTYQYENGTNRLLRMDYSIPRMGSLTDYRNDYAQAIYGTGMYADRIEAVRLNGSNRLSYTYDDLGRITKQLYNTTTLATAAQGYTRRETSYTYLAGVSGSTTSLVATVNNSGLDLLTYSYDSMGNIKTIQSGSKLETYTYDNLNQLVRVDSQKANKSTTYSYDNRGNLLERKEYAYTTGTLGTATKTVSYAYGDSTWKDLMTTYNGQSITYDTIGNPLKYRDGMNFSWVNGRQLAGFSKGPISADYEYDIDGMRTRKTFNRVADSITTEYYYNNGMLLGFYRSDGIDVKTLLDADGGLYGLSVMESAGVSRIYYFVYNIQGDVVGLYSYAGTLVATYDYDVWGNCTVKAVATDDEGHSVSDVNHIAQVNPFRYRGYYYDTETGLYYLGSRYYDPETGRFLNADNIMGVNDDMAAYNLFVYCGNNPINRYDDGGMLWRTIWNQVKTSIRAVLHVINTGERLKGRDTAAIGACFLNMKRDPKGVYHASFDCWQQYFGYCDFYDFMFDIGTSMKSAKFPFSYKNKSYILWAWKGDYINLGAGAELGIYYGGGPLWRVDKRLAMNMTLTLKYKKTTIITYSERTWWITGFNPRYINVKASDLTATFTVRFNDSGMFNAFRAANRRGWTFNSKKLMATYTF